MNIIQPFDLTKTNIETLLKEGKIVEAKNNKVFRSTIFPSTTTLNNLATLFDNYRIITQIDANIFNDFYIVGKEKEIIYNDLKTTRDLIKIQEFGDYTDSIKRYTATDKPIDVNTESQLFLNLPKNLDKTRTNIKGEFKHNPDVRDIDFIRPKNTSLFEDEINHPYINNIALENKPFKFNDKSIIDEILKWAKDKNIYYIYCIIEHKPFVINYSYTLPFVYYTVKGAKK